MTEQRVIACLMGLATGDAIGKQTETLTPDAVRRWYPDGIEGFHGEPGTTIPRYAGKTYEWKIGETTDDTEQTLAVARALLAADPVRHEAVGRELMSCKKSVHPPLSIWRFQQTGDPAHIATEGDGCGAAMRVAPVGITYRPQRLSELIRAAYECSIPTHGGQLALSAAAAVAGALSAAIEGWPAERVLSCAQEAAYLAESRATPTAKESLASSIVRIYKFLTEGRPRDAAEIEESCFPNTPYTIVPLAIALALATECAERAILVAANIGGDADSVASIGGAIAAAMRPETVNRQWMDVVRRVNGLDLDTVAASLASRRR